MRMLHAIERASAPWKNGGGVTQDVMIWPSGASLDSFDWRISIADILTDGPFSIFPGISRVLTVIQGDGLRLAIGGAEPVELDSASPPLAFSGEAVCHATLTKGRLRDLNVMARRGAYSVSVRRLHVIGETVIRCDAETTLAVALDPLTCGGERLNCEDAALAASGENLRVAASTARVVVAEISPSFNTNRGHA
ncbi:MAG: HutD family protein [Rhodospirillaceae bacterium]|nr:HutD family protein [Rhodospirillaceae bacterium]